MSWNTRRKTTPDLGGEEGMSGWEAGVVKSLHDLLLPQVPGDDMRGAVVLPFSMKQFE